MTESRGSCYVTLSVIWLSYYLTLLCFAFFQEHPVFNPMGDCCKEEQDRKPCGDCIEQVGQTEGLLAMATVLSLGRSIAALPIGRLVRYFTLALPVRFNRGLSFASFPVAFIFFQIIFRYIGRRYPLICITMHRITATTFGILIRFPIQPQK